MSQALTFIVLGFASGAIYVGISLGLIAVYFASGILNFSQAASAMWGGYVYAYLKTEGKLVFPIGTVRTHHPMATLPAFIIAVANGVLLGVVLHLAVADGEHERRVVQRRGAPQRSDVDLVLRVPDPDAEETAGHADTAPASSAECWSASCLACHLRCSSASSAASCSERRWASTTLYT